MLQYNVIHCSCYSFCSSREAAHVHDHRTDRVCDNPTCRGTLEDSIINFGEMLPKKELEEAFIHARAVRETHYIPRLIFPDF